MLKVRRLHWLIEMGWHYRCDVTFHEDADRMIIGRAGSILWIIYNLSLALLKQAVFTNLAKSRRVSKAISRMLILCSCRVLLFLVNAMETEAKFLDTHSAMM